VVVESEALLADPVLVLTRHALEAFGSAAFDQAPVDDAVRIDRIGALEELGRVVPVYRPPKRSGSHGHRSPNN